LIGLSQRACKRFKLYLKSAAESGAPCHSLLRVKAVDILTNHLCVPAKKSSDMTSNTFTAVRSETVCGPLNRESFGFPETKSISHRA